MFGLCLKPIFRISDKVIIRTLRKSRLGHNPGLDKRLKVFQSEGLQITNDDADSFMEQSASDFYKVGEVYNEHMNETLMGKYALRHRIVKEKYFKENMPNLLTWSEKEQIRHLATTEPDDWTPEKIAESFPVTPHVVKRLLKYPWKPATEQRVARHDSTVMRNWRELKDGSLDVPEVLRNHFLKFANRTIPPIKQESLKIELKKEENIGEFESIVRRCAGKENYDHSSNNEEYLALPDPGTDKDNETKTNSKRDFKRMTLEDLKRKINNRLEKGSQVDICDKIIVDTVKTNTVNVKKSEDKKQELELFSENIDKNTLVAYKDKNVQPNEIMHYPERIRIPKKVHKKGATYKVNDCYYDHDGRFLYRVLGLSN